MTHLVIALGNPLREDDGVGWAVAQVLQRSKDVRVIVAHQLTPEMAEEVSRADAVVFVDARRGGSAGELRTVPLSPAAADHRLTHVVEPATLLHYAQILYGRAPTAWLVSVAGERFGLGDGLSASVLRAVPAAARQVRALAR
jgi:hydrogenase maturation protease